MATQDAVNKLQKQVSDILAFNKERLTKRSEWGTITFEKGVRDFDRIIGIASSLKVLPVEVLNEDTSEQITRSLNNCRDIFERIDKFSLETGGNPSAVRDDYVNNLSARGNQLFAEASPWIPFLAYQKGDVGRNIAELVAATAKASSLYSTAEAEIATRKKEVEAIVVAAREASASAGAAVFTEDFNRQSGTLETRAKKWLWATAGFAAVTLLAALGFYLAIKTGADKLEVVQKAIAKVAILAVLVTATIWCGRIYKALMHQAAVYRFKALGLQTFRAFSAGTQDAQTKDTVLIETTRAIFSVQDTGYIDNSGGESGASRIVEVVKTAAEE